MPTTSDRLWLDTREATVLPDGTQLIGYSGPPTPAPRPRAALEKALRDLAGVNPRCRCGLHARMTDAELVALGAGCTGPRFACPKLDAVRRRVL